MFGTFIYTVAHEFPFTPALIDVANNVDSLVTSNIIARYLGRSELNDVNIHSQIDLLLDTEEFELRPLLSTILNADKKKDVTEGKFMFLLMVRKEMINN